MIDLKVASAYIRGYRDHLGKWATALGTVKAVASSGGIAAWVIWREYAFVRCAIIAASQVADGLKDVFPFSKKHKAASEHTITLNGLFIDAQLEWESIFSGRYTDDEIVKRRHKLMKLPTTRNVTVFRTAWHWNRRFSLRRNKKRTPLVTPLTSPHLRRIV